MRLAVLLLMTLSSTAAPATVIPSYDEYGSWLVACDNVGACEVKAVGGDDPHDADIRLDRSFASDEIRLEIRTDFPATAADLALDGRALAAIHWQVVRQDDSTTLSPSTPEDTKALIAAMKKGASLRVGQATIGLDGFTAALDRMDTRQARHGPGRSPLAPAAPAYHVTATMTAREGTALLATLRSEQAKRLAAEGCEDLQGDEAYALDRRRAVAILACQSGAYQQTSLVFVVARQRPGQATLFTPRLVYLGETDSASLTQIFSATFDPASGSLGMRQNLRADGKCGLAAEWRWNGAAFRLASFSFQNACGGSDAMDWPTLFETGK